MKSVAVVLGACNFLLSCVAIHLKPHKLIAPESYLLASLYMVDNPSPELRKEINKAVKYFTERDMNVTRVVSALKKVPRPEQKQLLTFVNFQNLHGETGTKKFEIYVNRWLQGDEKKKALAKEKARLARKNPPTVSVQSGIAQKHLNKTRVMEIMSVVPKAERTSLMSWFVASFKGYGKTGMHQFEKFEQFVHEDGS